MVYTLYIDDYSNPNNDLIIFFEKTIRLITYYIAIIKIHLMSMIFPVLFVQSIVTEPFPNKIFKRNPVVQKYWICHFTHYEIANARVNSLRRELLQLFKQKI